MNLKISEKQLERCLEREERALYEFYQHCYPLMRGLCMRYIFDHSYIGAVVNDSFIKVINNLANYDTDKPLGPWISTITIRVAIDHVRKIMRSKKHISGYVDGGDLPPSMQEICWNSADQQLDAQYLLDLMNTLPKQSRIIFNMFAIDGFSHKEISEYLGISEGTSKWHVSNARKLLKKKIGIITTTTNLYNE